jgi:hypothetical protein
LKEPDVVEIKSNKRCTKSPRLKCSQELLYMWIDSPWLNLLHSLQFCSAAQHLVASKMLMRERVSQSHLSNEEFVTVECAAAAHCDGQSSWDDTYLHVFSSLDMIKAILEMTVKLLCHSWSFAHLGKKKAPLEP